MTDNCTHDCASCGEDCADEFRNQTDPDLMHKLSSVNHAILLASAKGGVGKSALTCALAGELVRSGFSAAILDGNLSGSSISLMFGVENKPEIIRGGIYPAVTENDVSIISLPQITGNQSAPMLWNAKESTACAKQFWSDVIWDNIDFLLIDTPADTADITQMFFQLGGIDGAILVTDPSEIAALLTCRTVNMAKMYKTPLFGIVENFSDRTLGYDCTGVISKNFEIPLLDRIPTDEELYQLSNKGEIYKLKRSLLPGTVELLRGLIQKSTVYVNDIT